MKTTFTLQHLTGLAKKGFLFLSIIFTLSFPAAAQINAYASVTGISGNTLSLSNVNQTYHTFNAGDEIIIMQMQDNVIGANTINNALFGAVSSIANAGVYEVAKISSVAGLPASIVLTGATLHTYNFGANSSVQIISFRSYGTGDYTTTAAITALPWNGKTGGVVAMQVKGSLTVAYPITANGAGFRGGAISSNYEVNCEPSVYATSSANYAGKGEGIHLNTTGLINGRARLGNGGGGGSDDNGGGGGGSNYTTGGQGGFGWTCSLSPSGGIGGDSIGTYVSKYRVFMGGGGGGGQQNNSVGTAGANGGGIVFLRANVLMTSCTGSMIISANGANASNSGNDGSGGGGAAGSVIMNISSFNVPSSCPLIVQSSGGNGGNVTDPGAHGGGGGGGEGVILYPSAVPTTNISNLTKNGSGGNNNSTASSTASSGSGINNQGIMSNLGSIVLPVTITGFSGHAAGQDIVLSWNTVMEQDNDHFNVQRSSDGGSYSTIGLVQGAGNSNQLQHYTFTDLTPVAGRNSYRLQQVDKDGLAVYSNVVVVDLAIVNKEMMIYPNPVIDQFTIRLSSGRDLAYQLSLLDLSGRVVLYRAVQANGGLIQVSIATKLTPGIYLVRLKNEQGPILSKIIVR